MIDTTKLRTRNDVKQAELIAMVPESPNEEVRREMD